MFYERLHCDRNLANCEILDMTDFIVNRNLGNCQILHMTGFILNRNLGNCEILDVKGYILIHTSEIVKY